MHEAALPDISLTCINYTTTYDLTLNRARCPRLRNTALSSVHYITYHDTYGIESQQSVM